MWYSIQVGSKDHGEKASYNDWNSVIVMKLIYIYPLKQKAGSTCDFLWLVEWSLPRILYRGGKENGLLSSSVKKLHT